MPKDTGGRLAGQFFSGVLEGYLASRKMGQENRAEQRSVEVQNAELKTQQLQQRKAELEMAEFEALRGLRQAKLKAEVAAAQAKDPIALRQAKVEEAQWNAKAAQARAEKEAIELQFQTQLRDMTEFLNRLKQQQTPSAGGGPLSFLPPSTGSVGGEGGIEEDVYANMPAVEPAGSAPPVATAQDQAMESSRGTMATVPGGRRVLTGPPKLGSQIEAEQTNPIQGMDEIARTILPPGMEAQGEERTLPILPGEVKKALDSKDVNKAIKDLLSPAGAAFGAELAEMKQNDPLKYQKTVIDAIEEHAKLNPIPYKAYAKGGLAGVPKEDPIKRRVIEMLTDPNERALQIPMADIDAAVSEAVAEQSAEALLSNERLGSYFAIDRAHNGDIARYNGHLLNQAMDEVFGGLAGYVRFADDLDYTLKQVVQALYVDEFSSSGSSMIPYDLPLKSTTGRPADHPLIDLFRTYWSPAIEMEGKKRFQINPPSAKMVPRRPGAGGI